MLKEPIHITALSSLSSLETTSQTSLEAYKSPKHSLVQREIDGKRIWIGELQRTKKEEIVKLRNSDSKYKNLDDSVLFAIYTARNTIKRAGWGDEEIFGINIGSSRGATTLFEHHHQEFLNTGIAGTLASPTTTLGNISSWVAHDLKSKGPVISHSITCSTALHALLNGIAWIQSGLTGKFLVGGSEAPLTPFTIAQMQALKIYSNSENEYPCRAVDLRKTKNTMVLGEGAVMASLEKGNIGRSLCKIIGIGYATETLEHNVSISINGKCFQDSMKMALGAIAPKEIDAVVVHAPGTIKGDVAEIKAIEKVFGKDIPFLTSNKWKIGHTFGASGLLSVEMAVLMLLHQIPFHIPYIEYQKVPKKVDKVLINALGFGGNAVSIVLSR